MRKYFITLFFSLTYIPLMIFWWGCVLRVEMKAKWVRTLPWEILMLVTFCSNTLQPSLYRVFRSLWSFFSLRFNPLKSFYISKWLESHLITFQKVTYYTLKNIYLAALFLLLNYHKYFKYQIFDKSVGG